MLVAWVVGVQVLAAAGDVGSVDGPQAFVETRAVVDDLRIEALRFKTNVALVRHSGLAFAQQARVSAGWGIPLGRHRLLPGVTWKPSVFLFEGVTWRAPMVTAGVLTPTLATVFVTPHGVVRPRLSLHIALDQPWLTGAEANLHVRRELSPGLFVGLEVDGFVRVVGPDRRSVSTHTGSEPSAPELRCPFPERRCAFYTVTRWSGEFAALAEWRFRDDWSLAGRLSVSQRSELIPTIVSSSNTPDVPVSVPQWIATEASFDSVVTWSPTRLLGLSASFAVSELIRTDGYLDRSATVGLSVWLRTDARLQRNWLDL